MTTRYMRRFFEPESIAVIGASERNPSLGGTVLKNILQAGFRGTLMAVNPHGGEGILGVPRFASVAALPEPPDLAVVCTQPETIPRLVDELGKKGVRAVLIVMGGLSMEASPGGLGQVVELARNLLGLPLEGGKTLKEAVWEAAQPHDLRIMGPNCIGVVVPRHRLNASYAHCHVPTGEVAYFGQSGMLGLALMDYAAGRGIGFSHVTTLGDSLDIDIADVIEYLEADWQTRAIVVHVENLTSGRRFMSALRAAARSKLVFVLKSNRNRASDDPLLPVAPGLGDPDQVYDAAFRRAGVLRVDRVDELFQAVETLTRMRRPRGERIAVMANGIGPALLACDQVARHGGTLAELKPDTVGALMEHLPRYCQCSNPVDLSADATPERFARVLEMLLGDTEVDALMVLHVPTTIAPALETARAVIPLAREARIPVLTSWMGHRSPPAAREAFDQAGISTFDTPEQAVDAFMRMVEYRRNQDQLSQTPPRPQPGEPTCDTGAVWAVVGESLNAGRELLTDPESMRVLQAAAIPVAETHHAADLSGVTAEAACLTPPLAVKVLTEETCRPFGQPWSGAGIALDLGTIGDAQDAARALAAEARRRGLAIGGFKLQRMRRGLGSIRLSLGITRDPVFGPLLFFGAGGSQKTAVNDRWVGFPPLNLALATALIDATAAGRGLSDFSRDEQADREALAAMLVRLGQLVVEVPMIAALEINPLIVNPDGILALDWKIAIGAASETAIVPYPAELEETATLKRSGREVLLRPIRAEDAPAHAAFVGRLSPEAIRYRFFRPRSNFTRQELAQATQIDYAREMAFIATAEAPDGEAETLGVVRAWTDPDNVGTEFAVIVDDAMRGEGLGTLLMNKIIAYARARGILEMRGTVLPDNRPMLALATRLGFESRYSAEEEAVVITLALNDPTDDWQRERLRSTR